MKTPINVLIVEDSEEDTLLVLRELSRGGFEPFHLRVDTAESMRHALVQGNWDLIIADFSMPSFDGLAAFRICKDAGLDMPFIIVSGSIGEDVAVEAMRAGVNDYVLKGKLARLAPAIERELKDAAERSALRQAEEKLLTTERLRTVGELTASLIHDLKNPLQSILSSGEILGAREISTEKRVKYSALIEKQVERILTMSQEIMDFVRGDMHLAKTPVDLLGLTRELTETYAPVFARTGVDLRCETRVTSDTEPIMADRDKIWRALLNLITNAKDAMPSGGQVQLMAALTENEAILEVSDNGQGIPEAIQDVLFNPFVTHGKRGGTGLGLAIVKQIADAHKGSVSYHTRSGVGTTFRLTLPRDSEPNRIAAMEYECGLVPA